MVKPNPLDGHEYDVRRDDCVGVDGRSPDLVFVTMLIFK
jgi:hypothetical protein